MPSNRFEALEEQAQILHEVADFFPHESRQYIAIENAAFAMLFAITEHYDLFVQFVNESGKELSETQKEHLKSMGIIL